MEASLLLPFLEDKEPILAGPSGEFEKSRNPEIYLPVCLGCFKSLRDFQSRRHACSRCGWAMCSIGCQEDKFHSKLECPVFSLHRIPSSVFALKQVFILRALLLEHIFPAKWKQLMNLQHEFSVSVKKGGSVVRNSYRDSVHFIRDCCNMGYVKRGLIKRIVNLKFVNSLEISKYHSTLVDRYYGIAIFENLSTIPHSCYPSMEWMITPKSPSTNHKEIAQYFTAIRQPEEMDNVTIARNKDCLLYGTVQRQQILQTQLGISCNCTRCADPTENGSFYSALICQDCHPPNLNFSTSDSEKYGFLLHQNPWTDQRKLMYWKCSTCHAIRSKREIKNVVAEAKQELDRILDSLFNDDVVLFLLQNFISIFSNQILHKNHYLIIEAERNYVECNAVLKSLEAPGNSADEMYKSITQMAQHCLAVYSMVLASPYLEPVMMMHLRLVKANEIFYFAKSKWNWDAWNYFHNSTLFRVIYHSKEYEDNRRKLEERLELLDKALAAHNFNYLPKSPFVLLRESLLLKQRQKIVPI